jgi:hypothetical protein
MNRYARLVVALLCLGLVAGCTTGPAATPSPTSTAVGSEHSTSPTEASTAAACMSALISGQLVIGAGPGVDLKEPDGSVRVVIWPDGYTFSSGNDRAVMNAQGTAIAKVGDHVELGGGESGPDNAWKVCPDQILVKASSAP